jgi:arylsulfatase I/J
LGNNCFKEPLVDLWANDGPAWGINNNVNCTDDAQDGCVYEDDLFAAEVLAAINTHDPSTPMFLVWAPHIVHHPYQVPADALAPFADVDFEVRARYAAMVAHLDGWVGQVRSALEANGMWDNTVWMVSSDNGGPVAAYGKPDKVYGQGGNNYPLRGGKTSNFEGGVRVNAFVSGGYLPVAARGRVVDGLSALCDVYSTYCALAGADPFDEVGDAYGLPAVDGVNLWPWLVGDTDVSPRSEVPLGATAPEAFLGDLSTDGGVPGDTVVQGLIRDDGWKLLIGMVEKAFWQGPLYPNTTLPESKVYFTQDCGVPCKTFGHRVLQETGTDGTDGSDGSSSSSSKTKTITKVPTFAPSSRAPTAAPTSCSSGCLYNIFDDPTEHVNLADTYPDIVQVGWEYVCFPSSIVVHSHPLPPPGNVRTHAGDPKHGLFPATWDHRVAS